MKTISKIIDQSYECGYHYTEGSIRNQKRVNDLQSWIYPNLDEILFQLQEKWNDNNVPLEIETQDKRIKWLSRKGNFFDLIRIQNT